MATATATQATVTLLGVSANGTVHLAKETKDMNDLNQPALAQKCGMGVKVSYLQPAPAGAKVTCKKCAKLAPAPVPAAAPAPAPAAAPAMGMLANAVASQAAGANAFKALVALETAAGNFVDTPAGTRKGAKSDKPAEPKEMHTDCVDCGFHFIRPQTRPNCKVANACAKRQAAVPAAAAPAEAA
jgi:hypothetical protein